MLRLCGVALCFLLSVRANGDGGQPGYGGDGGQGGYGPDGGQGGYGEVMQEGYGGKEGRKPHCPPGQTAVTKPDFRAYGNGCGTSMIKVNSAFDFEDCCTYTHDVCYVTCGMQKEKCETLFSECMQGICSKQPKNLEKECNQNAGMYTMGTTMMGGKYFKEGQVEACDCVADADAGARRKTELLNFYKEWAPDQMSKVDNLFKKYEENFPRLMLMLHQKYKDSVKVVERSADGGFGGLNVKVGGGDDKLEDAQAAGRRAEESAENEVKTETLEREKAEKGAKEL